MTDYKYDLGAIASHKGQVSSQHSAISGAASGMSATGAGGKEMYGILIGQIAHPILSHTAQGAEDVLTSLSDLLDGMTDGLQSTIQAYQDTETDHIDRTSQIVNDLNSIGE
ncbi:hypothetical protein ACSDQ9_03080 [Aestuariimicrobium soli]|uniref:hypothetical protein n=1 Tax=Aestuariimicrobium soli TaxID=2035834 RepID=UPI003EC08509